MCIAGKLTLCVSDPKHMLGHCKLVCEVKFFLSYLIQSNLLATSRQ